MTKKILILILLLLTFSIDAVAIEKASDKFAKKSFLIGLTALGFSSTKSDATQVDSVYIHLFTEPFKESITINISSDETTIIAGSFTIYTNPYSTFKDGDYVSIRGFGINNVTDEPLFFNLTCYDAYLRLTFNKEYDDLDSPIRSPLQVFSVHKNFPSTAVEFVGPFNEQRRGTLKQLRKNLQALPYVRKRK